MNPSFNGSSGEIKNSWRPVIQARPSICGITASYTPSFAVSQTFPMNRVPSMLSTMKGWPCLSFPRMVSRASLSLTPVPVGERSTSSFAKMHTFRECAVDDVANAPGFQDAYLAVTATQVGVREPRRIVSTTTY